MKKDWKIIGKETVLETPWRGMDKYRVQTPSGKEEDFFMVTAGDAVMIFALTKDNKVVVNSQYHFYHNAYQTELPAGFVEDGDIVETAKAELMEETGCTAETFVLIGATNIERWRIGRMHYVVALGAKQVADQQLEDGEDINVIFMDIAKFRDLLKQRRIQNGPSVIGAYMALDYLNLL